MSKDTATILSELQQGMSYPADIRYLKAERDEAREELARLRAELERYKAIERAAKRIKRNARKYRAFRYITHSIAQDIWCIVPREDIMCLKEAVAALPAAADPATEDGT